MNRTFQIPAYYLAGINRLLADDSVDLAEKLRVVQHTQPAMYLRAPIALQKPEYAAAGQKSPPYVENAFFSETGIFIIPLGGVEQVIDDIQKHLKVRKSFHFFEFTVTSFSGNEPDIIACSLLESFLDTLDDTGGVLKPYMDAYREQAAGAPQNGLTPEFVFNKRLNVYCADCAEGIRCEIKLAAGAVELAIILPRILNSPMDVYPFRSINTKKPPHPAHNKKLQPKDFGINAIRCTVPSPRQLRLLINMGISRALLLLESADTHVLNRWNT